MLRKVQGRAEAEAMLDAAEASGLSRSAWARLHGVDARSLNAWRVNLIRPGSAGGLVELVAEKPEPAGRYRVLCGDLAVEVDDDFRESTLRRLLLVMASC